MNTKILKLFTGIAAMLMILAMADATFAQRRGRNRGYSKVQVDRIITNVEDRVDQFVGQIDSALDRNKRLDGTRREDQINRRAKDLERATDALRSDFNRRERYNDSRAEVSKCLNIAADINVLMRRRRFDRKTESNWRRVRSELNTLARVYNLPNIAAYR